MQLTTKDGMPLKIGAHVTTFRGEPAILRGMREPHTINSTGRVYVEMEDGSTGEYFPSVIGAEWRE